MGFALARFVRIALLLCVGGVAHATTVAIVATERSSGYLDVAKAMTIELEKSGITTNEIALYTPAEWTTSEASSGNYKVIVTLGSEALKHALGLETRAPVVAALLPRIGYERALRDSGRKMSGGITAVYLDQSFNRRVDLIKLILPDARKIGVLWGPDSVASQSNLMQAATSRGLGIENGLVANPSALFGGLKAVLDESDVLLAVADPQVYSSATIANILMATYRSRIPVVAFSPAYVKAGAMVAIYATPAQIGQQAAGLVRLAVQGSPLPAPQYPHDFEISVNDHVAKSLGLNLDARVLTEKLSAVAKRS